MSLPDKPIRHEVTSPAPSAVSGKIVLFEQTWAVHIEPRHTDVPLDEIKTAMSDPCQICESKTETGRLIMINTNATNEKGQQLRVPLKDLGSGNHIVTSAYYGSAPHGDIAWRRGDD